MVLVTAQNAPAGQIAVRLLGESNLILNGVAGNDTFNLNGPLATNPATINLVAGGSATSSVANLTGNSTAATVTLGC